MFEKLAEYDEKELCKKLGYKKQDGCLQKLHALKEAKTLYEFISDPKIGFDMHLSSEEFLKRVVEILGIDKEKFNEELQKAKERKEKIERMFQPYIFINTGFKRKDEPIFALAFMEPVRRLKLDKEWFLDTPFEEQLEYVSLLVRKHYMGVRGRLKFWGGIKNYVYFYDANKPGIVFNTKGEIVEEPYDYSEANVEVKKKKLL